MSEKYEQAYRHIQVVRGTFYGMITHDDLQFICERYELTSEESAQLEAQLKEEGASIISNDEKNAIVEQTEAKNKKSRKEPTEDDLATTPGNNKELIAVTDDRILEMANVILSELKWSEQEITAIKTLIRNAVCHVCEYMRRREGPRVIAAAIVEIGVDFSRRKVEKQGGRCWVCGTYTSRVQDLLATRLRIKYLEERLTALVNYCNDNETGNDVMEALLICLIKDIRPIRVNITPSSFFY